MDDSCMRLRDLQEALLDLRKESLADLKAALSALIKRIRTADRGEKASAERRWASIAKPLGSLGVLEEMISDICAAQAEEPLTAAPVLSPRALVIFCADNGIVEEGVTQTGQEVTASVARNITRGKSCSSIMAASCGTEVCAVDIGMRFSAEPCGNAHPLAVRPAAGGTRNFAKGPAMTEREMLSALLTGAAAAALFRARGIRIAAAGEMGIGNTSSASAVVSCLAGLPPEVTTGRGAGLSDEGLLKKTAAVREGLRRNRPDPGDALDVLMKVGGFDIAAMAGFYLGCAAEHIPAVLDGYISGAAALAAASLVPEVKAYLLASHVSSEPGAVKILERLGKKAPLNGGFRLGEGTGALMLFPMLDMAAAVFTGMETFGEMGIRAYTPFPEAKVTQKLPEGEEIMGLPEGEETQGRPEGEETQGLTEGIKKE